MTNEVNATAYGGDGTAGEMNIQQVFAHLPHRYPFLLIDRVVAMTPGQSIRALKNVSINEPYFVGHFPIVPVMPGVLIIEAMAQATGLLAFKSSGKQPNDETIYLLVGVDNVRFKRQVSPGDQLMIDVTLLTRKRNLWKFAATASVDGATVAQAEILCTERQRDD